MNILLKLLPLYILLLLCFESSAKHDFKAITKAELANTSCPIDKNAEAYYIIDKGQGFFEFPQTTIRSDDPSTKTGFQYVMNRHYRIKILKQSAVKKGNIVIPIYVGDNRYYAPSIKAFTYNLINNKIVKDKVRKSDIYEEKTTDEWVTIKFALPNVRVGSIIDVSYTLNNDQIYVLPTWQFQHTIPSLKSIFELSSPEYLEYTISKTGTIELEEENKTEGKNIQLKIIQKSSGSTQGYVSERDINYIDKIHSFTATNIPAFPDEEYTRSIANNISKVDMVLKSTHFPLAVNSRYNFDWNQIAHDLERNKYFGKQLNKIKHLNSIAQIIKTSTTDSLERAQKAFRFIKNKMRWNGENSIYAKNSIQKAFAASAGNSADINLNLIGLLNKLNLNARPVLLSTQEHGRIPSYTASLLSMNHLIVYMTIGNKKYMLDASSPYGSMELLPKKCLNGKGLLIGNNKLAWVQLETEQPYYLQESYALNISEEQSVNGRCQANYLKYASFDVRNKIAGSTDYDKLKKSISEKFNGCEASNIKDSLVTGEHHNLQYSFEVEDYLNVANNLLLLKPVLQPFFDKNPFSQEQRILPIEFSYPLKMQQMYTINIPENYTIVELPKPAIIVTPNNDAKFTYSITQLGSTLHVTTTLDFLQTTYPANEYATLKDFSAKMLSKLNEHVVLKNN